MSTKTWTSKADFDTGTLSSLVDHRNNDLQLICGWSAGGNLNVARNRFAGCGTQTAGLSFGGYTTTFVNTAEEYNGFSWFASSGMNTARGGLGGAGTQAAGVGFGGTTGSAVAVTEEWNAPVWYPVGGYYESQPVDVECPHNRWYRLEVTLIAGSTPEVTEINQNYGEDC